MKYVPEYEALDQYDELLDEIYGEIDVCGYSMDAYRVLKEMDPIAYREGFLNWLDANDLTTDEDEADEGDE